jgi:beta-galactosidase
MNGLLAADGTPHSGLSAIKYIYRNVHVRPVDLSAGRFAIKSWFDFSNIQDLLTGEWILEGNGKEIARGTLDNLDIAARSEKEITIDLPELQPEPGVECFVTLRFLAKDGCVPMVAAGHELAVEQFKLPVEKAAERIAVSSLDQPVLQATGDAFVVTGKDFSVVFDRKRGAMESYTVNGRQLLKSGPQLDLWRAYTDNDKRPFENGRLCDSWRDAAAHANVLKVTTENLPGAVRLSVLSGLPTVGSACKLVYTVYGSGEVVVDEGLNIMALEWQRGPHRVGTEMVVAGGLENMQWFGRGPASTYIDRDFDCIGMFSGTVDEQWMDYSRPQENGNKTGVRWVTLTDDTGAGLLFAAANEPLSVGAKHYSKATMEASKYSFEMERSEDIFLNVDYKQLGVGGNNSWGKPAILKYHLLERQPRYSYRIRPVKAGTSVDDLLKTGVKAHPVAYDDLLEVSVPAPQKPKDSEKK